MTLAASEQRSNSLHFSDMIDLTLEFLWGGATGEGRNAKSA